MVCHVCGNVNLSRMKDECAACFFQCQAGVLFRKSESTIAVLRVFYAHFWPTVVMMFSENPSLSFFLDKHELFSFLLPPLHAIRPDLCFSTQNWKGSDFSAQFYSATERRMRNKRKKKVKIQDTSLIASAISLSYLSWERKVSVVVFTVVSSVIFSLFYFLSISYF